eukprot:431884-Rhodomonas_salina.2
MVHRYAMSEFRAARQTMPCQDLGCSGPTIDDSDREVSHLVSARPALEHTARLRPIIDSRGLRRSLFFEAFSPRGPCL